MTVYYLMNFTRTVPLKDIQKISPFNYVPTYKKLNLKSND